VQKKILVFKFGGASVKDADAVRNVAEILKRYPGRPLMVVVSAMGKTTNALEALVKAYTGDQRELQGLLSDVISFHLKIVAALFPDSSHPVYQDFLLKTAELSGLLSQPPGGNFDYEYDQIVGYGEQFSAMILSRYLSESGIQNTLFNAGELIVTDKRYRRAGVNWEKSIRQVKQQLLPFFEESLFQAVAVTQGFIARAEDGSHTTLGREGSDFSAAILAYILDAEELIIWKDVPGLYNADPRYFSDVRIIEKTSYKEALELSWYGAGIIHPDTIKPLQNKNIPLRILSFSDPSEQGTLICGEESTESRIPCYIHKDKQLLLSISTRDFSYVNEEKLHEIFGVFSRLGLTVNVMQNSAISFSVCMDDPGQKKEALFHELSGRFVIRYNENLTLITIRNYTQDILDHLAGRREVLLEHRSRYTCQLVVSG